MDIPTRAEVILREANYETWPYSGGPVPMICFENQTVLGFLHSFPSAHALLEGWDKAQQYALRRHGIALRSAGAKAWNVYSVFLAERGSTGLERRIERIEEDFTLARKIVCVNVQTSDDLIHALLPLLPIRARPMLGDARYNDRIRARVKDVASNAVSAFLGAASVTDVVHILETRP